MTEYSALTGLVDPSPVLRSWGCVVEGILSGDAGLIEENLAENAVFYDMYLGTVRGAATIARVLGGMKGRAFNSATAHVEHSLSSETTGATEWVQYLSTATGAITVEVASFVSMHGGRITRLCDYIQPLENRKL